MHVFFCERAALRLRCSAAGRGVLSWVHVVFVSAQRCCTLHGTALNPSTNQRTNFVPRQRHRCGCAVAPSCSESCPRASAAAKPRASWATGERRLSPPPRFPPAPPPPPRRSRPLLRRLPPLRRTAAAAAAAPLPPPSASAPAFFFFAAAAIISLSALLTFRPLPFFLFFAQAARPAAGSPFGMVIKGARLSFRRSTRTATRSHLAEQLA